MIKIERGIFERLGFDFEAELKRFSQAKAQHAFTVNVPAPSSDPLVEAAFEAGGYEVVDPPQQLEPPPPPESQRQNSFEPDPRKASAIQRLQKLKGQKPEFQLDEIREVLNSILDILPG
jgi:hypothetical protein